MTYAGTKHQFVICVDNEGYPASLERWKVYRALPDRDADGQVLGELFRENGFDGVAYRSSYGPGHNTALFDLDLAEQVNCFVVRVKDITFAFEDEQHSYTLGADKPPS